MQLAAYAFLLYWQKRPLGSRHSVCHLDQFVVEPMLARRDSASAILGALNPFSRLRQCPRYEVDGRMQEPSLGFQGCWTLLIGRKGQRRELIYRQIKMSLGFYLPHPLRQGRNCSSVTFEAC